MNVGRQDSAAKTETGFQKKLDIIVTRGYSSNGIQAYFACIPYGFPVTNVASDR